MPLLVLTVQYKPGVSAQRSPRERAARHLLQQLPDILARTSCVMPADCETRLVRLEQGGLTTPDIEVSVHPSSTVGGGRVVAIDIMDYSRLAAEIYDYLTKVNAAQPAAELVSCHILVWSAASGVVIDLNHAAVMRSWGGMPAAGTSFQPTNPTG